MWYNRMELEIWFDRYQYEIEFDIGESAVKTLSVGDIGIDLENVLLRYGYHRGKPDLREVLAAEYPGCGSDHIVVTTGASEANFIVVSALVEPGDHVIIEHPNYPSLYEVPRSLGCNVTLFSLRYEDRFQPDWDKLRSLMTPRTKLVSLTHPNNPTGSMITAEELQNAVTLVEEFDAVLLFDETYRHMAFDETRLPPAASLSDRVVSISSMSKCYGLPGIRTGWLATRNREVLQAALAIREQLSISNNSLGEEIALDVLQKKDLFLEKATERIKSNRDIVAGWMDQQADFEWIYPEAGVVCLPRLKAHFTLAPEALYRRLAEEYKTFVVPGRCFEMDARHFRIGFGADAEEIEAGLGHLQQALADLA